MPILSISFGNLKGVTTMAWKKPIVREIECGMEINMYGPDSDDHGVLF